MPRACWSFSQLSTSELVIPEPVVLIADVMSAFRPNWFLCGGWAVDAWLGRQTRDHGDIDITVFHNDQRALFDHLTGWQLIGHDPNVAGDTEDPWDGRTLDLPAHIHARPGGGLSLGALNTWGASPGTQPRDGSNLEVILNERFDGDWILNPEPRIALPLRRSARQSVWGLPTAVPEAILFYKATAYFGEEAVKLLSVKERPQDESDFFALLPHLIEKQRDWLRKAISLIHPGHPWLPQLAP